MKKLILFSFGGTLVLSDDDVINVWRKAIKKAGLLPDEQMIYLEHYGEDFEKIILPKMAAKYKWTAEQVNIVVVEAKKVFRQINSSINSGLADKLTALKKEGLYFLALISNRKLKDVKEGLSKIGLNLEMFDFVKTAENGVKKPDPKAFDILEHFSPEEVIFVGSDPNKDWTAAKALGIDFVPITTSSLVGFWQVMSFPEEKIFLNVPDYVDSLLKEIRG